MNETNQYLPWKLESDRRLRFRSNTSSCFICCRAPADTLFIALYDSDSCVKLALLHSSYYTFLYWFETNGLYGMKNTRLVNRMERRSAYCATSKCCATACWRRRHVTTPVHWSNRSLPGRVQRDWGHLSIHRFGVALF